MAQLYCSENKYKWIYLECKDISSELIEAAGSLMLAQLLVNRNIDTPEKITAFLNPADTKISSPYAFENMEKAVSRINQSLENKEHIVIYGDFDADGVTSTSLLFKTLRYLDANVSYFIPDRSEDGHGLNSALVCRLISSKKAKLIITVDCGISNYSEISLAKSLGTDVIITDHHEAHEIIPPAYAIINPKLGQINDLNFKYLAGVGVAYKLACALLESHNKQEYADELLPLVAIGTIADVVPLIEENRTMVYKGLKLISEEYSPGLIKLLETAKFKITNVSADSISFGIAPRINAIGRLAEAGLAVDLLVSDDPEEIDNIANKLNYNNRLRQQMCESTFIEAQSKVNAEIDFDKDNAIILADSNWHPGIIGIVASKLVEKYYRPVFLIVLDKENNIGRCSARGINGLNLHDVLVACSDLFERFGGHAFAAGFSFDLEKTSFISIKNKLLETINEYIDLSVFEPKLNIDMDISSDSLTIEFINELNKLAPFGDCNPSPIFSISNLTLKQFKTMGSANNHLKLFLTDDKDNLFEAVWWQKNSLDLDIEDKLNVAFSPDMNVFNGKARIQLIVKDIQAVTSEKPVKPEKLKTDNLYASDVINKNSYSLKWIDHRKKNSAERLFSNYFRTTKDDSMIFAESQEILEKLGKDSILKSKIINRINACITNQLMFFDLPPDLKTLQSLVDNSCAKIIHLISKKYNGTDPNQIIKTVSGMLKYAHSNKNGEITINHAASFLSVSDNVVFSCIKLLDKAGVIGILEESENLIRFEFIGKSDMVSLISLEEYKFFLEAIKLMEEFRYKLASLEINDIQNMLPT